MITTLNETIERRDTTAATMKALVFQGPNHIGIEQMPIPKAGPGEAVIRVTLTTICGTDLHIVKGEYPVPPGLIIGHESVGVIHELGVGVTGYALGDRVLVAGPDMRAEAGGAGGCGGTAATGGFAAAAGGTLVGGGTLDAGGTLVAGGSGVGGGTGEGTAGFGAAGTAPGRTATTGGCWGSGGGCTTGGFSIPPTTPGTIAGVTDAGATPAARVRISFSSSFSRASVFGSSSSCFSK